VTATGAGAGSNLAAAGPISPTAADAAVTAEADAGPPASGERVGDAVVRSPRRLLRAVVCGILAVLAGVAAWLLLQHGIRTDAFPPFLAATSSTPITRYSGPWITAAAAAGLLAGLVLLFALFDAIRWSRAAPRSAG
jgi:hypothetical protein